MSNEREELTYDRKLDLKLAWDIQQADIERLSQLTWSEKDRIIAALRRIPDPAATPASAMREALVSIRHLTVHLREGGPDISDLNSLSEALQEATDIAYAALAAPQAREGDGK